MVDLFPRLKLCGQPAWLLPAARPSFGRLRGISIFRKNLRVRAPRVTHLIPADTKHHGDRVPNSPAAALLQVRKVCVVRKLRKERLIERRHLFPLGARSVSRLTILLLTDRRSWLRSAENATGSKCSPVFVPHLIVAHEIVLKYQPSPPH